MPRSKKRKKNGKKVGNGAAKNNALANERLERVGEMESEVTLQDLINMVAYQEYEALGLYDKGEDVKVVDIPESVVDIPESVPVTFYGPDGTKRQIGTASPIPGEEGRVSVHIDDEDFRNEILMPSSDFSIDFEDPSTQAVIKAARTINEENA